MSHADYEKRQPGREVMEDYGHHLADDNTQPIVVADKLSRKLSARQVQMIAIGGTIGTGLFLGTGKSLSTGGPASMLISYAIVGAIVFITMLALGEMAAFVPVAGSFCTFAGRFVDDAFGFALTWNYWFNDAVSTASDLIALQLLLEYWTDNFPGWAISLIFLFVVIGLNVFSVKAYGEAEYWLSLLKVVTIVIFIIIGVAVNCGGNTNHQYIGGKNWYIGDAPFVGGIGGFASVFVTASFAYGGTESIAVTAGETKDPAKTLPRVVKNVFWRILLFYILSVLIVGLNVPYNYPDLSSGDTSTSPFTIVFQQVGSAVAGSFINAVIMTSVISASNHALFAGSRLLYTLAVEGYAPSVFGKLNRFQVPWVAVLGTSVISGLCFGASYIGAGQLWTWLQNIVGVSNQLSWISIGFASLRFRAAIKKQGLEHLLPFKNWTYPYGPILAVILNIVLVLVQGWSAFSPSFAAVDFVSYYIEIPIMIVMFIVWKLVKRTRFVRLDEMDLVSDRYDGGFTPDERAQLLDVARRSPFSRGQSWKERATAVGEMCHQGIARKGDEGLIAINTSLGRVFSKGFVADSSSEAVKNKIRPHLDAIFAAPLEEIAPYKGILQRLADNLDDGLAELPLWHYDLNYMNVLVDEKCHVSALIDWELSHPRPFGVGFGRIRTLAGEYDECEFYMSDGFNAAERGFWKELFDGMPKNDRNRLGNQVNPVQDAVILGALLDCFFFEDGNVGFSEVALKALPKSVNGSLCSDERGSHIKTE
ncbi:Lysine-specific permease [Talaromyces islandicus]|uniref:Lysine-specific permease n=1 Tax=Talaromyces islandicus TaxID=28573 RepID=A0A0U1LT74_TALIS|nr:Lysine-specific permease [Talaromyces islandicus]